MCGSGSGRVRVRLKNRNVSMIVLSGQLNILAMEIGACMVVDDDVILTFEEGLHLFELKLAGKVRADRFDEGLYEKVAPAIPVATHMCK